MTDLSDLTKVPEPAAVPRWQRYADTIPHLKPDQMARLFARRVLGKFWPGRLPVVGFDPTPREGWSAGAAFLDDPAGATFRPEARSVRLVGIERTLGDPVDWLPASAPLLWRMELHYFHWMPSGLPWEVARPWMVDWLANVSRDPRAICWSPFAVAQRVLRWTRLCKLAWREGLADDPFAPVLLRDLYAQCRYLSHRQERELLGNHLLKTALALYAGGRFFGGPEADGWLSQAATIVRDELHAQVLPDGGHYERSPMYHLFVLVDVLDALNVTPRDDPFEAELRAAAERLTHFAGACAHGDGEIPLFNDSVLGQAPERLEVLRYAERLGVKVTGILEQSFAAFPNFGLFRLGNENSCLWLDAGETGPSFLQAHAHADTGSFELSVGPHRIVTDSGVFSYQDRARRAWDRSTPAHNTVSVSGESSSDCWGGFRVGRRARVLNRTWHQDGDVQEVRFRHDGFRRLPGSPRHERAVAFRRGLYTIADGVTAGREVVLRCDASLYFASGIIVAVKESPAGGSGPWRFLARHEGDADTWVMVCVEFVGTMSSSGAWVEPATVSPNFHTERAVWRLRAACVGLTRRVEIRWSLATRQWAGAPPSSRGSELRKTE